MSLCVLCVVRSTGDGAVVCERCGPLVVAVLLTRPKEQAA